jgi:hypothetical protein
MPEQAKGSGQIIRVMETFSRGIEFVELPYLTSLSLPP